MAAKIKKGDKVVVSPAATRAAPARSQVIPKETRALVRGVNMVKRHQRQTATQEGGIISKEAPIHLSNLASPIPRTASRPASASSFVDGRKVRFAKRSGEI
jgi:large subunit ribosomal protein L24